jgi:UDP-N-acetylmuramate--alanine ligase
MAEQVQPGTRVFLAGICGAGMSSLALLLQSIGVRVRGSDLLSDSREARRLAEHGIDVLSESVAASQLEADEILVRSSAIGPENPVYTAAQALGMQVVHRSDVLAQLASRHFLIAVAGTHGKTTTTGMIGYVLAQLGFVPTIYVGGRILGFDDLFPPYGPGRPSVNGRPVMVLETDESDRSFLKFHPDVAVVTNVDEDHLGAYGGSFQQLVQAFEQFGLQTEQRGGTVVGCGDDAEVLRMVQGLPRRVLYGSGASCDASVTYDAATNTAIVTRAGRTRTLAMEHGDRVAYLNAVAACLSCEAAGAEFDEAVRVIAGFPGMERRMQVLSRGVNGLVVTDHADHPTEIRATLEAVRARYPGTHVVLVLQPHRYSRVASCTDGYGPAVEGVSRIFLLDIFPAGEQTDDPARLNAALRESVRRAVGSALEPRMPVEQLFQELRGLAGGENVIVFMGPGDVNGLALTFAALLTGSNPVQ